MTTIRGEKIILLVFKGKADILYQESCYSGPSMLILLGRVWGKKKRGILTWMQIQP